MASETPSVSRIDALKAQKIIPPMPPNPAPHIVAWLVEIGLTEAAGMGAGPVSWATIAAWQSLTGVDLSPWEARLIRALSVAYVAESRSAESENCPPPWRAAVTIAERNTEVARLELVLG